MSVEVAAAMRPEDFWPLRRARRTVTKNALIRLSPREWGSALSEAGGCPLIWGFPLALQKMMQSVSMPRNERREAGGQGSDSVGRILTPILVDAGSGTLAE